MTTPNFVTPAVSEWNSLCSILFSHKKMAKCMRFFSLSLFSSQLFGKTENKTKVQLTQLCQSHPTNKALLHLAEFCCTTVAKNALSWCIMHPPTLSLQINLTFEGWGGGGGGWRGGRASGGNYTHNQKEKKVQQKKSTRVCWKVFLSDFIIPTCLCLQLCVLYQQFFCHALMAQTG